MAKRLTKTKRLQREVDQLLDVHQVARLFGRTTMTISLWRRQQKMPTVTMIKGERTIYRFVPDDVVKWARKTGKTIVKLL